MCSAHSLMVLYIGVKFRENTSKGFRVMEQTRNYEGLTDQRTDGRVDGCILLCPLCLYVSKITYKVPLFVQN